MLEPNGRKRRMDGVGQRPTSTTRTASTPASPSRQSASFNGPVRQVRQRFHRRHRLIALAVLTPLAAVIAVGGWILWPRGTSHKLTALSLATSVIKSSVGDTATLQGQLDGRTNMVVYGMTKDGLRTDSIMLASYYWQQKKLVTLNIPRDLQIYDGYETCKFGEVYAYALARNHNSNTLASQFVADLIAKEYGIPVPYWLRLNMQGEVELVNTLGGIDINVPDAFTDYEYPTWNYTGYITPAPHFSAGLQHMDGDTALIYSRSRHSLDNNEGSDFARSQRQMLVLGAVLTKVKSLGIVGNIGDISHYLTILGDNVDTNMSTDEIVSFGTVAKALNPSADLLRGSWATGNGFLCSSISTAGAYIALYGVTGDCETPAGGKTDSKYRELAIYYVNHLIDVAPMDTAAFITAAGPNLPAPYTTSTTAAGTQASSNQVLSAQSTPTPSATP